MSLDECIRTRRSIRRYQPRDVSDAVVGEVLDLARHAPSSMGGQPLCFVVVRDGETKRRLADTKDAHCAPEKRADYPAGFLAAAPVVVAVCVERERAHGRERENAILGTAYLLLAAHQRGLGSVYLSAYQKGDGALTGEIRALLGLPPEIEPVTLVPLGYPAETPVPTPRRALAAIVHAEVFGRGSTRP